jgi:hypothetical protein
MGPVALRGFENSEPGVHGVKKTTLEDVFGTAATAELTDHGVPSRFHRVFGTSI